MRALQDLSISILVEDSYDNIKAFLHRGILYNELERYDEAIKDFESVLELDKQFAPAHVNLGIIFMNLNLNYWK
jgi:lipoprotein NlpI